MLAECDVTGVSAVGDALAELACEKDGLVTFEASEVCSLIPTLCDAVLFDSWDNVARAAPLTGGPPHRIVCVLFCLSRTSPAILDKFVLRALDIRCRGNGLLCRLRPDLGL